MQSKRFYYVCPDVFHEETRATEEGERVYLPLSLHDHLVSRYYIDGQDFCFESEDCQNHEESEVARRCGFLPDKVTVRFVSDPRFGLDGKMTVSKYTKRKAFRDKRRSEGYGMKSNVYELRDFVESALSLSWESLYAYAGGSGVIHHFAVGGSFEGTLELLCYRIEYIFEKKD